MRPLPIDEDIYVMNPEGRVPFAWLVVNLVSQYFHFTSHLNWNRKAGYLCMEDLIQHTRTQSAHIDILSVLKVIRQKLIAISVILYVCFSVRPSVCLSV